MYKSMDLAWSQHVGSWQMPRWMTTSEVDNIENINLHFNLSTTLNELLQYQTEVQRIGDKVETATFLER